MNNISGLGGKISKPYHNGCSPGQYIYKYFDLIFNLKIIDGQPDQIHSVLDFGLFSQLFTLVLPHYSPSFLINRIMFLEEIHKVIYSNTLTLAGNPPWPSPAGTWWASPVRENPPPPLAIDFTEKLLFSAPHSHPTLMVYLKTASLGSDPGSFISVWTTETLGSKSKHHLRFLIFTTQAPNHQTSQRDRMIIQQFSINLTHTKIIKNNIGSFLMTSGPFLGHEETLSRPNQAKQNLPFQEEVCLSDEHFFAIFSTVLHHKGHTFFFLLVEPTSSY